MSLLFDTYHNEVDAFLLAEVSIHPGTDQRGATRSSFLSCDQLAVGDASFHSPGSGQAKQRLVVRQLVRQLPSVLEGVLPSVKVRRWALTAVSGIEQLQAKSCGPGLFFYCQKYPGTLS